MEDHEHTLRIAQIQRSLQKAQYQVTKKKYYEALVELDTANIILRTIKEQHDIELLREDNK